MKNSSTPTIEQFRPVIPYQAEVIQDVLYNFDYSLGTHEVLLSGSVGSAKSILMAHLITMHCLQHKGAVVGIGRKVMRDLKGTLYKTILLHCPDSQFTRNKSTGVITFKKTGSQILPFSWKDGNYVKFRSYEFSMFVIEELTENSDEELYNEIYNRVGRLTHIDQKLILMATNPDDPTHWAYKRFILKDQPTTHVYYSVTKDNPFLPASYIQNLETNLDKKLARRMIYGEWIEIAKEVVYYSYSREKNFKKEKYIPDKRYPIRISFDFNIGIGKPMSCVLGQFITQKDEFHFFEQSVIHGARTEDVLEDLLNRGLLTKEYRYIVNGDATGKNRDTRNKKSDYDIIHNFLLTNGIDFQVRVPLTNPAVRKRHNTVNAYCLNEKNQVRLFVYEAAGTLDEGFRLTKLKEGSQYVEDDSKEYQHITTAAGYSIMTAITEDAVQKTRML